MKELMQFLDEKRPFFVGDAKPCKVYINQAWREAVAVTAESEKYNVDVAYRMPNGRMYIKPLTASLQDAKILQIDVTKSVNLDGGIVSAFGF